MSTIEERVKKIIGEQLGAAGHCHWSGVINRL